MKTLPVRKVDVGIVTNGSATRVVWSKGRNVRFHPGGVKKTLGKTLLATVPGALSIRAIKTFKGHDGITRSIVCCDNKIFAYKDGFTSFTEITPSPVPTGTSYHWQFGLIGGMLVLSNGISRWKWNNYAGPMTAWAGVPTLFGALTVSSNRIVVGNIVEDGLAYPARIRWGGIGKPEAFTIDRKGTSGRKDLIDPNGESDAIEIPRAFTRQGPRTRIYTEKNIWSMDPSEFPLDYRFNIVVPGFTLLAPRAVVTVDGIDYAMGEDDFYMIGGGSPVPFGFDIRETCFENLNKGTGSISTAFAFEQPETKEVGFCVPSKSAIEPDTTYLYHRELKVWTILDCNYLCASDSRQDPAFGTDANLLPYQVVGNVYGQILKLDAGFNDNGAAITGYIESGDFEGGGAFVGKVIHAVAAYLAEQPGTTEPLMIQVGTRKTLSDPVTWSTPRAFSAGIDASVDIKRRGKWVRVRFYSDQIDSPWDLEGYELLFSEENIR